jgi:hypothetical protein
MKTFSCRQLWALAFLTLLLVMGLGCSGVGSQTVETSGQQLPFSEAKPLVVPANTVVYIRLRAPITSHTAQAGQSFAATLDEPLLVESQVAAPQGAEVGGKIVVARDSGRLHGTGYVRITLCSITVKGKTSVMQTSSAIAGGGRFRNRSLSFMRSGVEPSWSNSLQSAGTGDPASPAKQEKQEKEEAGFGANLRIAFRLTQPLTIN